MLKKYKQTEDYYKNQMLGFGKGSIYDYGCFLVALTNGLNKFGYDFTPRTLNELLKEKELYTGEFKNYIDVARLSTVLPDIFTSFKKIEPFSFLDTLKWYLSRSYVVLGKVSAEGISGTGSHFVQIDKVDGLNAIIHDPYTDEYQAVGIRYMPYGNILGLRVFGVKQFYQDSNSDKIYSEAEMTAMREQRDENWRKYQGSFKEANERKKELNQFIDELAEMLGATTLADKANIKGSVTRLTVRADERDKYKNKWEREVQARKADYDKHQEELQELREEIKSLQGKLKNLDGRIDTAIEKSDDAKEVIQSDGNEPLKASRISRFINWLVSLTK